MKRWITLVLDAIEIFYMVPVVAAGLAAIAYFITPDFFRVTLAGKPAPATVRQVITGTAPKFVTLSGGVDYTGIRYRCRKYNDLPRCIPEEYLYPFFDGSAREGIYIKTKTVPEDFAALHPGKVAVTAVPENVSANDRKYLFYLDASEISERTQKVLDAYKRIDMNRPGTADILRLLSVNRNTPAPVSDRVYLNEEYHIYRGVSGYFIGIFSIVITLAGSVLLVFSVIAGVGEFRARRRESRMESR